MKGSFNRSDEVFQRFFSFPMTASYLPVFNEFVDAAKTRREFLFKTVLFAFILWRDALSEKGSARGSRLLDRKA